MCHTGDVAFTASRRLLTIFVDLKLASIFQFKERVFAHASGALHIVAEARCFRRTPFAARYAELRWFAAENRQAVENERETIIALNIDARESKLVQTPKERKFHHSVYVVLLENAVAKHPSILRVNPKRDPLKPCVYVGMTGLPVDHRFENHKNGYKSAWVVRKYGLRLMPQFYDHLNPMPYEAAAQMEKELAEDMRAEGYTVTGGK